MFGRYRVEPRLFSDWRKDNRPSSAALASDLRALVAQNVKPGVNTVLVGHINGGKVFGVSMHEGEALVLTDDGSKSPSVVGVINSARWGDLVGDDPAK